MEKYADFILPIAPFTETISTYVNVEGNWQSSPVVSVPAGEAKPAWKILRVLANLMELPGFEYAHIHEVLAELTGMVDKLSTRDGGSQGGESRFSPLIPSIGFPDAQDMNNTDALVRLAPWLMYRVDGLTRRAGALQATMSERLYKIAIHENVAKKLNLSLQEKLTAIQGDSTVTLPWRIDNRLAENAVFIPMALAETAGFGQASAPVRLQKENAHG